MTVINDNPAYWFATYDVASDGTTDTYTGTAQDGSEFAPITVPTGTAALVALGVTPAVPASITNFQARAVLLQMPGSAAGRTLFQDVDDALRNMGGAAWQAWEFANEFTRHGALVGQMGARFGMSDAQLDGLFIAASPIRVTRH